MPIYEYQCVKCGYKFEKMQSIKDDALRVCPKCGKKSLEKLISLTSFKLKGTGWYETDFKKALVKNKGKEKAGNNNSTKVCEKKDKALSKEKDKNNYNKTNNREKNK